MHLFALLTRVTIVPPATTTCSPDSCKWNLCSTKVRIFLRFFSLLFYLQVNHACILHHVSSAWRSNYQRQTAKILSLFCSISWTLVSLYSLKCQFRLFHLRGLAPPSESLGEASTISQPSSNPPLFPVFLRIRNQEKKLTRRNRIYLVRKPPTECWRALLSWGRAGREKATG